MLAVNRRKGWSYKHEKELSGEFRHPLSVQLGPFVLCSPLRSEDKLSSRFLLLCHRSWPSVNKAAQRRLSLSPANSRFHFQPSRHQIIFFRPLTLQNARNLKSCDNKCFVLSFTEVVLRKAGDNARLCRSATAPAESRWATRRPFRMKGLPTRTCSTPRESLTQAWLRLTTFVAHSKTYWHVVCVFLIMHWLLWRRGPYIKPDACDKQRLHLIAHFLSGFVFRAAGFFFPSLLFFTAHQFLTPKLILFLFHVFILLPPSRHPNFHPDLLHFDDIWVHVDAINVIL